MTTTALQRTVTIAIPTLSAGPVLDSCLRALEAQTFQDFEVIVINNGSNAFSPQSWNRIFACQALCPGSNVGFGAAVNLAVRSTASPFIATLNDDTEPDPGWLGALVHEMERHPAAGMCASRIRLFEAGLIDSTGMLICLDGSSKQRGQAMPAESFSEPTEVLLPSACAALYRRQLLDEIGLFDEDYFLYCEDTDLGLRARWAGWGCRYAAHATIRHHYSHTAGAFSALKAGYVERNRLWVAVKNFPLTILLMTPFVTIARYFWQLVAVRDRTGSAGQFVQAGNSVISLVGIVLRAHFATFRNLPTLLRKRAAIRRTQRIGSVEFTKLLLRHRITARGISRT